MDKILKDWIERDFYKCNHRKYHKYFEEWFNGITLDQITGFENMRTGQITQSKVQGSQQLNFTVTKHDIDINTILYGSN